MWRDTWELAYNWEEGDRCAIEGSKRRMDMASMVVVLKWVMLWQGIENGTVWCWFFTKDAKRVTVHLTASSAYLASLPPLTMTAQLSHPSIDVMHILHTLNHDSKLTSPCIWMHLCIGRHTQPATFWLILINWWEDRKWETRRANHVHEIIHAPGLGLVPPWYEKFHTLALEQGANNLNYDAVLY